MVLRAEGCCGTLPRLDTRIRSSAPAPFPSGVASTSAERRIVTFAGSVDNGCENIISIGFPAWTGVGTPGPAGFPTRQDVRILGPAPESAGIERDAPTTAKPIPGPPALVLAG